MRLLESLSRKLVAIFIYLLVFLGFFQIQEIIFSPTMKNLEKLFLCIILSSVVSYANGFTLFKGPSLKKK
jgi:hypothetical protein